MSGSPVPHYRFWWEAILALPPSRSDVAYTRLDRVFRDQTRPVKDSTTGRRGQQFTDPSHETHFTVTLWENFVLFPPARWLPSLWSVSGLMNRLGSELRCNWSYEWAEHGNSGARHCDIVLEYEDAEGRGVLVLEAKKPNNVLSDKDRNPSYYLTIPQIAEFERRSLVYLIDDAARAKDEPLIPRDADIGFLSWEQLASIQVDCADSIFGASPEVKAFVAASLYRVYVQHGITPKVLPLMYLSNEPAAEDVVEKRIGRPLGKGDWEREIWRL